MSDQEMQSDRRLTMTVLMTPDMVNFSGNIHGGHLLLYLDQVAFACASRYAGSYVVTLSVDQAVHVERKELSAQRRGHRLSGRSGRLRAITRRLIDTGQQPFNPLLLIGEILGSRKVRKLLGQSSNPDFPARQPHHHGHQHGHRC